MGKFEIIDNGKGPHFNLLATNGQVIGTSEVYSALAACKNGIESVKKNAPIANIEDTTAAEVVEAKNPKFIIKAQKDGKVRFNLTAKNGEVILSSQGYASMASCLNGIESVKKNAPDAQIVEG